MARTFCILQAFGLQIDAIFSFSGVTFGFVSFSSSFFFAFIESDDAFFPCTVWCTIIFVFPLCTINGCVFSSHSFWTSSSLDVPAGVTQEGHTGFFIHLLSAVRALIFLARRIQRIPFPRRP